MYILTELVLLHSLLHCLIVRDGVFRFESHCYRYRWSGSDDKIQKSFVRILDIRDSEMYTDLLLETNIIFYLVNAWFQKSRTDEVCEKRLSKHSISCRLFNDHFRIRVTTLAQLVASHNGIYLNNKKSMKWKKTTLTTCSWLEQDCTMNLIFAHTGNSILLIFYVLFIFPDGSCKYNCC